MKTGERHLSPHVLSCKVLLRSCQRLSSRRKSQGARILSLSLAVACLSAAAAQSTSDKTDTDTIHGIVTNSVTHEPIARALVSSPDNRFATLSNSEGRFEFALPKADPYC